MPGLTIHTGAPAAAVAAPAHGANNSHPQQSSSASRASSPTRPPISPITPTLGPALLPAAPGANTIPNFALGRPVFTHSQPDQVAVPAPPAVDPVSFDDNPDVLALKSAISILQLQRARAAADMQALSRAKAAALSDPHAFVTDLAAGRVGVDGDPLMFPNAEYSDGDEDTSKDGDEDKETTAWRKLPKPQSVVRCPPVNWAQYGVVGESLDKLHAQQVAAPNPGTPLALGPGGTYSFKAGDLSGEPPRRLVGIAAPYTPRRDKIEKRAKGGKR
ncbi:hypothetical protein B0H67DRAFT_474070 [Lasiosphaeris hirsuta]|uniref:Uncharacterized protein n=1 Tax=Lasiosphaeris hirsuta TaxID=260670 RepID=A0AA40BAZ0_9PEZI|nr:hypothetical protein B0H67DRAFT_474070 [Lasiosphaeris hirsuta]